jgi:hypothetical protein
MTMMTPRRLMTLHFSQRGLTDAETFTCCLVFHQNVSRTADNPPARAIVAS